MNVSLVRACVLVRSPTSDASRPRPPRMAICHSSHYCCLPIPTSSFSLLLSPSSVRVSGVGVGVSSVTRTLALSRSSEPSYKVRISRNRKSDEEICAELREFVSLAGLPLKRMPSLKVLSDNGRKDLAKAIKKRGYKNFLNLFISSVESDEAEENLSDGNMEHEDACDEDGNYRFDGATLSSEFPDTHQVEEHELINNSTDMAVKFESAGMSANNISMEEQPVLSFVGCCSSGELNDFEEKSVIELGSYATINSLKALLDKKDAELLKLKEKIEEEKAEFLKLQEKAKAKIANVELTIKDNCCVTNDAEDKLKGLKEVHIEFMADAEVVEIAGSFNGWKHRLKMNLNQSSESEDPSDFRQAKVWSTMLYLYPGIYQIKFVVDGNWIVDHKRELDTIGDFANNVLRVE